MKKQLSSIKNLLLASTLIMSSGFTLAQTTVYDVIAGSPNHTYLTAALDQEGLDAVLDMNTSQYTVFAPDNAAFDQLIIDLGLTDINDVLALTDLANILKYHVLSGSVPSSNVSNGQIVSPLHNDNTLKLTINGTSVFANQAEVNGIDLMGSNGYVHSINSVLLDSETVADIAIDSPDHTTLVAALVEARLLPALTNPFAELTVFAPTDAAFTAALASLNISAADLLASPDLAYILLYHVIGSEVFSTSLTNGPVTTLNGQDVIVDLTSGVMINDANVTNEDIASSNGVVHIIDGVLLPNLTSIEENNNLNVLVYPNPAVNVLNITLNSNELFNLTITDLNGKQILAERISSISNMVDISNLSSGMYLLRIANSNVHSTTKIQINK